MIFTATVGHQEPPASDPAATTSTTPAAAASATKAEDGYPKAGMWTIFEGRITPQ